MRLVRHCFVAVLIASLSVSPAFAQARHAVDPSVVAGLVRDHFVQLDADRAAIRHVLARPDVMAVASSMGIDIERLDAAVQTWAAADVARTAGVAREVGVSLGSSVPSSAAPLVGGASTVTISTTTVIIGLLILILIIVAVR